MKRVVFIHVMRTGGTSVRNALRAVYPPEASWFDDRPLPVDLLSLQCIAGHVLFNQVYPLYHQAEFVTILREPVEREISHLNRLHTLRASGVPLQPQFINDLKTAERSLDLYIERLSPSALLLVFWQQGYEVGVDNVIRFLSGFSLVGFTEEMPVFFSDLSKLLGVELPARTDNWSKRYFDFTPDQKAHAAWRLRDDVAIYNYMRHFAARRKADASDDFGI